MSHKICNHYSVLNKIIPLYVKNSTQNICIFHSTSSTLDQQYTSLVLQSTSGLLSENTIKISTKNLKEHKLKFTLRKERMKFKIYHNDVINNFCTHIFTRSQECLTFLNSFCIKVVIFFLFPFTSIINI